MNITHINEKNTGIANYTRIFRLIEKIKIKICNIVIAQLPLCDIVSYLLFV